MPNIFAIANRTYKMEKIYMNNTANEKNVLVSSHLAIFEVFERIEHNDFITDYMGSCVTFQSESKVPAGNKHNVYISLTQNLFRLK